MNGSDFKIRSVVTRVMNMIARATVAKVDDSTKMQGLQIDLSEGETREVEHPQPYGLTAHPPEGAEAAVAFVGGRRDHGLVLVVDDRRYRIKNLAQGEVALYTDEGDSITIKRGGVVEVKATTKLVVTPGSGTPQRALIASHKTAIDARIDGLVSAIQTVLATGAADPSSHVVSFAGLVTFGTSTAADKDTYDEATHETTRVEAVP